MLKAILFLSGLAVVSALPIIGSIKEEAVRAVRATADLRGIHRLADGTKVYPVVIVADQDKLTAVEGQKDTFAAPLFMGNLHLNLKKKTADVEWLDSFNYTGNLAYKGRGMEFSDLRIYGQRMITVDDKTGFVYKLDGRTAIPWTYMGDADGFDTKPFKAEWITLYDGMVYTGGHGTEFVTPKGEFVNEKPMYIKKIDSRGTVTSIPWAENFKKIRRAIEIEFPGYMVHESCQFSTIHRRWFFLPRHLSKVAFDADTIDHTGANVLLSFNENFEDPKVVQIGEAEPERGYSAFQFIPGTNATLITALKTVEENGAPRESYISVFSIKGEILLPETLLPGRNKFEGIEFFNWKELLAA